MDTKDWKTRDPITKPVFDDDDNEKPRLQSPEIDFSNPRTRPGPPRCDVCGEPMRRLPGRVEEIPLANDGGPYFHCDKCNRTAYRDRRKILHHVAGPTAR